MGISEERNRECSPSGVRVCQGAGQGGCQGGENRSPQLATFPCSLKHRAWVLQRVSQNCQRSASRLKVRWLGGYPYITSTAFLLMPQAGCPVRMAFNSTWVMPAVSCSRVLEPNIFLVYAIEFSPGWYLGLNRIRNDIPPALNLMVLRPTLIFVILVPAGIRVPIL